MSIDRPVFIVEVKVAEGWQLVGSAPTRDAAATLAAAAVRRISTDGRTYTQVRIYVAMGDNLPADAARACARGSRRWRMGIR